MVFDLDRASVAVDFEDNISEAFAVRFMSIGEPDDEFSALADLDLAGLVFRKAMEEDI